jgi:hypothetical protein
MIARMKIWACHLEETLPLEAAPTSVTTHPYRSKNERVFVGSPLAKLNPSSLNIITTTNHLNLIIIIIIIINPLLTPPEKVPNSPYPPPLAKISIYPSPPQLPPQNLLLPTDWSILPSYPLSSLTLTLLYSITPSPPSSD